MILWNWKKKSVNTCTNILLNSYHIRTLYLQIYQTVRLLKDLTFVMCTTLNSITLQNVVIHIKYWNNNNTILNLLKGKTVMHFNLNSSLNNLISYSMIIHCLHNTNSNRYAIFKLRCSIHTGYSLTLNSPI